MKLSLAQLVPCIKSKRFSTYVLYGSHETLVQGVIREVSESFSCQNKLADQFEASIHDLATPSLFGTKPLVTVVHSPKPSVLGALLPQWPQEHILIAVLSSCPPALMKNSKIAAIACYESTFGESKLIFQRYVERHSLKLDPEAFDFCVELSRDGGWSSIADMLTLCGQERVRYETVAELFSQACPELSLAFLGLKTLDLEKTTVEEPIKILRLWQKVVMQMWQLKIYSKTRSLEDSVKCVHPPIFFKNTPYLLKEIGSWDEIRIIKVMQSLLELEASVKKNSADANILITQFLKNQMRH